MKMVEALICVQDGRCFYCGDEFSGPAGPSASQKGRRWTRDHVFPKHRGFTLHNNFILACRRCNADKGGREPTLGGITRAYVVMQKAVRLVRIANGQLPTGWTLDRSVTDLPRTHSKAMPWWERYAALIDEVVRKARAAS